MKKIDVIYKYLIFSFFAAFFIILFAVFDNSKLSNLDFNDKLLVGFLFIICCIFGISLTFYPGWYKRIIIKDIKSDKIKISNDKIKRKGHHPDCVRFYNHTIKFKNNTFCAGCFGLAIGFFISISLMILYLFFINNFSKTFFYILLTIGFIIILILYLEIVINKRNKTVHIALNVFFVLSFFMITVSIFEITNKISYALISILLSFLWLDTRIQLSNRKHRLICANCDKSCKMY